MRQLRFGVGLPQIAKNLVRRLRYRWVYPWGASRLFPLQPSNGKIHDLSDGRQIFHEEVVAHHIHLAELLPWADDLCLHRFHFLNLPPQELGNPIDWRYCPEGDRLWR